MVSDPLSPSSFLPAVPFEALSPVQGIGSVLLITGAVLFIAGLVKTADPIETPEARRLTMAFNQALRQRLGITRPARTAPASVADKPGTGTSASPPGPPSPPSLPSPTEQAAPGQEAAHLPQ